MDHTRREFVETVVIGGLAASIPMEAQEADRMQPAAHCRLTINGQEHEVAIDPRVTLLDLLREHLQLTGTKKGCGHGQCGACTVLVNGRRINSCLTLAVMQDGASVTTIEGLAANGSLHP